MKTVRVLVSLWITALLGTPLSAQNIDIPASRVELLQNSTVGASEQDIGEWIKSFKSEMIHRFMMNPKSEFGKIATKWGARLTDDLRNKLIYRVEVKPIKNLDGVYIALFWDPISMSKSLLRTDIHAHGGQGVKKGCVAKGNELFYQESLCAARGYNLSGKDLWKFFSNRAIKSSEERVFQRQILDPLFHKHPEGKNLTLIAVSLRTFSLDTLGHEILHAYWNQFEEFRKTVTSFWNENVSQEDKETITNRLGFIYGESQVDVLINEFQAYLLQPKIRVGQSDFLSDFRSKYQGRLSQKLLEKDLLPQLSEGSCTERISQLKN